MRRLRLMNEVLPDPTAKAAEGSPRARTVRHMQRLLALAAATAAIGAGCTKEGQPTVHKEDESSLKKKPISDPTATTVATTTATTTETTTTVTTTTTASTATVIPPGPGYGVVDPMPPPAKCIGAAASVKTTATWKKDASGFYVELKLEKSTMAGASWDRKTAPYASGGKIVSTAFVGADLILRLVPDPPGSTQIWVYAPLSCSAGVEHVAAAVDVGTTKTAGTTVPVTLYDQY